MEDPASIYARGRNFSLRHRVKTGSGGQLAPYPMGKWAVCSGIKRPKREADNSPPSSAEVKNAWSYTSIPPYVFMAWCLVIHRDNFSSKFRNII
jgi:hypothetical protein